jgi:hypothetical protein
VSSEGKTDREIRRCMKRSIGRHKLMAIRRQENRALLNDNESPAPGHPTHRRIRQTVNGELTGIGHDVRGADLPVPDHHVC